MADVVTGVQDQTPLDSEGKLGKSIFNSIVRDVWGQQRIDSFRARIKATAKIRGIPWKDDETVETEALPVEIFEDEEVSCTLIARTREEARKKGYAEAQIAKIHCSVNPEDCPMTTSGDIYDCKIIKNSGLAEEGKVDETPMGLDGFVRGRGVTWSSASAEV